MLIAMNPRWAIKVTHEPSGESVCLNSNHFRSQHTAKIAAIGLIRARLYAKRMALNSGKLIANYELPDDKQFPDDINDFRVDI